MLATKFPFNSWLIAAPVLGCLALGAGPAMAQGQSSLDQISARLAPLNLSVSQQSQLNGLLANEEPKFDTYGKELRRAENELLRKRGNPDQAATAMGDAVKQLALEIVNLQNGIVQILTPDQQANLASLKLQGVYKKLLIGGRPGGKNGGGGGGAAAGDDETN